MLLNILKEKYDKRLINDDEYSERSMILEDEYGLNSETPEMMILKEEYAKCEINSREFIKRREELSGMKNQ